MSIFFTYNTCFLYTSNNREDRRCYNGHIYDDRDKHANHDRSKSDGYTRHFANNYDDGVDDANDDDNEQTQRERKKARR